MTINNIEVCNFWKSVSYGETQITVTQKGTGTLFFSNTKNINDATKFNSETADLLFEPGEMPVFVMSNGEGWKVSAEDTHEKGTAIIGGLGDSNKRSGQGLPSITANENVKIWDQANSTFIESGTSQSFDDNGAVTGVGHSISTANLYNEITGAEVICVDEVLFGSGFKNTTDEWDKGSTLYNNFVSKMNNAYNQLVSAGKNNVYIAGIVMSMGANSVGTPDYLSRLENLINSLREDISAANEMTEFVLLQVNEEYKTTIGRNGIYNMIEIADSAIKGLSVVGNEGILSNDKVLSDGDKIHHSADAHLNIYPQKIIKAFGIAAHKNKNNPFIGKVSCYLLPSIENNGDGTLRITTPFQPNYDLPEVKSIIFELYKCENILRKNPQKVQDFKKNNLEGGRYLATFDFDALDKGFYFGKMIFISDGKILKNSLISEFETSNILEKV